MTKPSAQLSREEMLAIWIAEKRKKKEQQSTPASTSIHASTQTKGSTRPTTIIRRQSSASASTSYYSASSTTSTAWNGTCSATVGRPPRSSMKSVGTPPHLQRARNLLQERNYNQRSILQSKNKTPAASDTSSRKRSISQRSPHMTMPPPTNPFPTPTTLPDTTSNQDPFQGLVIAVSSTPSSQFNMSPLSMAGFVQSPAEMVLNDSVSQVKEGNDGTEQSPKEEQANSPKEHSSIPTTSVPQLLSCTSRSVKDKDNCEDTHATTDQTPRHVIFAFEEDSMPSEEPRRRRRGSFLLLPTPSPFDPSCTLPSVEEDPSSQQSPPKSAASKRRSPLHPINDRGDEENNESESTVSESSGQPSYISQPQQQSQPQPSTPSFGDANFTFQISPSSAFSKVNTTHGAYDQQEIKAFEKENAVLGNQMTAQQRRQRQSQGLSPRPQLMLEMSSPSSQRSSFQLQPSPTSAFSKVRRSTHANVEILSSRLDVELSDTISEPANGASDKSDNLQLAAQPIALACTWMEQQSSTEGHGGGVLLGDTVKIGSKTVLESIDEVADTSEGTTPSVQKGEYATLLNKFTEMMVEKQDLQTRLADIRKSYEQRVTPFRDVFDDKRKLQLENEQLKQINAKIEAQNQLLRQQKDDVDAMVAQLQQQMMATLQAAVQNSTRLKQELDIANAKIQKLEKDLSLHQQAVAEASVDDSVDV